MAALVASILATAPAAAQSAGQWRGPQHIWAGTCGYCHGTPVAPEIRGMKLPAQAIAQIVRHGLPGMPAFHESELSDGEVAALAEWLSHAPVPAKAAAQ